MDPERWQKIKSVFDAVVEMEPAKRERFLDNSCASDPDLRKDVQKLLDSFENAESFIEQPAAGEVASLILEPKQTLAAGQRFAHYEILRQIGAGGMGEVYLANDEKLDRRVAIKILNEKFASNESNLRRFIHEAKAASSLNHPNILVIHEISVGDERNYIVSEYVEGKTLREVIQGSRPTTSEILDVAIQISGALIAAHGAHIVHRDIKPENIVIRPDGYVKILDFGLAKLIEQKGLFVEGEDDTAIQNQTARGVIMGTVNYMSPEQAKGETVDERTDIFSLGVVIYELIAGKTPFLGDSMSETFANLINLEPRPLLHYASDVQDELQRIVSKTLQKNKVDRYQTIKDLLSDLKTLRENLAFDKGLESSHAPDQKETLVLKATTGFATENTDENSLNHTSQIKYRKPFTAIVLGILLIGLAALGYYYLRASKTTSSAGSKKSLAVLPFVNASQDPNAEYLSDGITESIINNLSQLSGLKVMSRNSAFRFKNNQTETKNIASQLGVDSLVTGDIKQLGDKLIINVRLIDASDDSQIWGNQYVKSSADILSAQNEIAQAVAQSLRLKLTTFEQQKLAKNYTQNVEAYQLYLRGRFHVFKLTPPEIQQGIAYFQEAINLDPNYALAYAGISDAYRSLALGSEINPTENLPKAKAAANKAIEIDETLSAGYASLGSTNLWLWNWNAAESNFKRAFELNPNDVNAHLFYAHLLSNIGRHAEALNEIRQAREIDPLFPIAGALEGQFLLHAGQTDEALVRLQKTFELAPNFWMPHAFISSVYIEKEMYEEAIAEAHKASEFSPAQTWSIALEGYASAKSGKQDEARNLLNKLFKLSNERFIPFSHIALIYNGLGETDKALEWLEKAYEQRDPKMAFLKVDPKWNNLRSEPRFIDLLKRMNFE